MTRFRAFMAFPFFRWTNFRWNVFELNDSVPISMKPSDILNALPFQAYISSPRSFYLSVRSFCRGLNPYDNNSYQMFTFRLASDVKNEFISAPVRLVISLLKIKLTLTHRIHKINGSFFRRQKYIFHLADFTSDQNIRQSNTIRNRSLWHQLFFVSFFLTNQTAFEIQLSL